jgi:RHS repeat-associated protein
VVVLFALALWAVRPAAAQSQDEVVYFVTDAIGSVRVVTNASGGVIETHDFLPFGVETPTSSGNNPLFAGKERDATGADYSGARYFAAKLGRFMTPDPVNGSPNSPQTWNRYVYALNNPLTFVDPDGREAAPACSMLNSTFEGIQIDEKVCVEGKAPTPFNQFTLFPSIGLEFAENQGPTRQWPNGSGAAEVVGGGGMSPKGSTQEAGNVWRNMVSG